MATASPRTGSGVQALDYYVTLGKALSDPTRLKILQLVGTCDEYACLALEQHLPVSKSTISHHMKILHLAGLVSIRREGRFFFYRLERATLDEYVPHILDRL